MLSYWFRNAKEQSWDVIADALEQIDYSANWQMKFEEAFQISDGMLEYCIRSISLQQFVLTLQNQNGKAVHMNIIMCRASYSG